MSAGRGRAKQVLGELLGRAGMVGRVRLAAGLAEPERRAEERGGRTLDARLGIGGGKVGRGRLIELVGESSSGRTALAYRLAADTALRGELVAWVDLPRALDALHLQRAGVTLADVLWVQPPRLAAALQAAELLLRAGFATTVLDVEGASRAELARLGAGVWVRLLRAAREQRASAVVLARERCTGAGATLALCAEPRRPRFEGGLLEGLESCVRVLRDREDPAGGAHELQLVLGAE